MARVIEGLVRDRIVMATGIGGQGVQLASQVLASAAMAEGREVQLVGSYGGMMRGGNTEATVVIGNGPVEIPPVAPGAWAALVMHHAYLPALLDHLDGASIAYVNSSVVPADALSGFAGLQVGVPAVDLARAAGGSLAAAMVLLGALARGTGIVSLSSLEEAVARSIPSYRSQHVDLNVRALTAGFDVPSEVPPAWPGEVAT